MKNRIAKLSLLTFGISTLVYLLWIMGLDWAYSHLLRLGVSFFLAPFEHLSSELAELANGSPEFRLIVDGRKGRFPIEGVILPFVLLFSWQLALIFFTDKIRAIKTGGINLAAFYLLQVFFLLTFINLGTSELLNAMKESLVHSFGIFAVFFIIKDILWFRLHQKPVS